MMRRIAALAAVTLAVASAARAAPVAFTPAEIRQILRHGPWPQPVLRDPSNRVSGERHAIALGRRLFFDGRLSATGTVSCASCHLPENALADGRAKARGLGELERNSPGLWNAAFARWYGWGGTSDSLWSHSVKPILNPLEMGASTRHVARLLREDAGLACLHRQAFGRAPADEESALVDAGKAMAAFLETLVSARTPFDEFRDALARGEAEAAARYPQPAQRGLRLFIGRGNCAVCHFGPFFTNGEFADIGRPFFVKDGVDAGRYEGIKRLRGDRFNLLGRHNDDASARSAAKTRHVLLQPRNFGEFKVPGLRNVALTAPYMHDGSLASLRDVVLHYSELNEDRLHTDGERILRPLHLSGQEVEDLVRFLESLTDAGASTLPAPADAAPSGCAPGRRGS